MNMDKIFSIFGSIVTVALVWTVVSNGNSATVIRSVGDTFAHSIAAAQGRSQ
jgi:hypothetical protein